MITVTAKGNITYTYDASGSKLKKVTVDNSVGGKTITTTTTYLGALVFESRITAHADPLDYTDRLQFAGHEEGRTRFIPIAGATPAKLVYDYFLKDHLGNVRIVLTDDQQTDAYPAATMETATAAAEETYYTNLSTTRVLRPALFPVATGQAMVAKVGSGAGSSKIGPAIILKVMAGDKVNLQANSWWNTAATPGTAVSPLNDLILAMATAIAPVSAGKALATELQAATVLSPNITSFLGSQSNIAGRPKAYINWILLDEQFKYVSTGSGFEQVDNNGVLKTHMRTNLPVTASGYLYIYVSNETPNIDVFFDNLQVSHIRGPLVEETHYYPFGLTMAGISSKAAGKLDNRKLFNEGTERTTDLDLNWDETRFRSYDPQMGRFLQIDPFSEISDHLSPFTYASNNPILRNDPFGLKDTVVNGQSANTAPTLDPVVVRGKKKPEHTNTSTSSAGAPALPLYYPTIVPGPGRVIPFHKPPVNLPTPSIGVGSVSARLLGTFIGAMWPSPVGIGSERPNPNFSPFPYHGNRKDNSNPHIVYEFIFEPTDGFTPILKYGISDEYRNGFERPENQKPLLSALYGASVTWHIYTRTADRKTAEFIERLLVTQHENHWGEKPRAQIKPNSFDIWPF